MSTKTQPQTFNPRDGLPGRDPIAEQPANQSKPEETAQDKMATLFGGKQMQIRTLAGASEEITIRKLPVSLCERLLALTDDEAGTIELLCDKPKGWSDSLDRDDAVRILEEGDRLNADFFQSWFLRRLKRLERLAALTPKKLAELK